MHTEPSGNAAAPPLPSGLTKNQRKKLKKKQKKAAAKGGSPRAAQSYSASQSLQSSLHGESGSHQNGDTADSAAGLSGDAFDGRCA